jgi:hypothetical protein
MKKTTLFYSLFFIFNLFLSVNSDAQGSSVSKEFIMSVPSISSKSYEEIKQKLISIPGVSVVAYCETSKCFLMYYDPKQVESGEEIVKQIETLNPRYKTEIKEGTSISQLINDCKSFSSTVAIPK